MENKNSTQDYSARVCTNYVANMKQLIDIVEERLGYLHNCVKVRVLFKCTLDSIRRAVESFTVDCFEIKELTELFASMSAFTKSPIYSDILFRTAQEMDHMTSSVCEFLDSGYADSYVKLLAEEDEEQK